MSDTKNVIPFMPPLRPPAAAPVSTPPVDPPSTAPKVKMGLYALGNGEDIVLSRGAFLTVLAALDAGMPEEQAELAKQLRAAYEAAFV